MKRIFCLVFSALLIIACTACSEEKNDESPEKSLYQPDHSDIQSSYTEEESEESEPDVSYSFEDVEYHDTLPDYMKTNTKLYAKLLEKALKLYYSGILNGMINSDTYTTRFCKDKLPDKKASPEQRRSLAELCTVGGALEYFGYDCKEYTKYYEMYNGCLRYFSYDRDGCIYYYENAPLDKSLRMNSINQTLYFIFKYANLNTLEREAAAFAADEINAAVIDYYKGIQSGKITSSFVPKYTSDKLPKKNASEKERKKLADEATIAGAIDYAGAYTVYYQYIDRIGYNKRTHVITSLELHDPDIVSIEFFDTKLSVIFNE